MRITRWDKDSEKQPTVRPTEYRCFIREVNPLWRSGCGYLIADASPSSATQLPILTALHARFLLCSLSTIQQIPVNVNTIFAKV